MVHLHQQLTVANLVELRRLAPLTDSISPGHRSSGAFLDIDHHHDAPEELTWTPQDHPKSWSGIRRVRADRTSRCRVRLKVADIDRADQRLVR